MEEDEISWVTAVWWVVHATYSSCNTHALTSNSENKLPPMLYLLFLMNEERSSMLVPGLPFSMSE